MGHSEKTWDLDEVIATAELEGRRWRVVDPETEAKVTGDLLKELAKAPEEFFPKLVQTVLERSSADSSGISLLDEKERRFVWPAVVGGLSAYIGAGTPSDFGPCGTVLDRNAAVLFQRPERHFTYLKPITPILEEVLLAPFHVNGEAVGTIWAVIHEPGGQFDREDRRFLEMMSTFAASAYRVLTQTGVLETMIDGLPKHPTPGR